MEKPDSFEMIFNGKIVKRRFADASAGLNQERLGIQQRGGFLEGRRASTDQPIGVPFHAPTELRLIAHEILAICRANVLPLTRGTHASTIAPLPRDGASRWSTEAVALLQDRPRGPYERPPPV